MIYKVSVTYEKPPEMTVRVWRECMRESHQAIGVYWHRVFLPRHFTRGASERYNYAPRSSRYRSKKRILARRGIVEDGGERALVFSGDTRSMCKAHAAVRGFPTRTNVTMQAPHYVRIRPLANRPYMYGEITRVINPEMYTLSNLLNREVSKRFNDWKRSQTVQVI